MEPLRYAFDLGTNSIGWAVYRLNRSPDRAGPPVTVTELRGCGVRLFDDGRNPKDGRSLAEMRRVPRSSRKRRDRFVMRRATLIRQLIALGLLPSHRDDRIALAKRDPYRLRTLALDEKLLPFEIGRALLHINQRRGFQSNRRADRRSRSDEKGKIARAIAQLAKQMEDAGVRTFGEYLWKRHGGAEGSATPRTRQPVRIRLAGEGAKALYEIYPARQMLLAEFDAITAAQSVHHAGLTADTIAELRETIFHQRPLKPVEVGRCTFVPEERRLPRALPSVEARVAYETVNQLRFGRGLLLDQKLTAEQRDLVVATLLRGQNITFKRLRATLKLPQDVRISLEAGGKSDLKDYIAKSAALASERRLGERWFSLQLHERDKLVQHLIDTDDDRAVVDWLQSSYGVDQGAAQAIAEWNPPDGYSRIGPTANAKILEQLRAADLPTYAEAVLRAGWHHSDERDGEIRLPLPYYGEVLERHILFGSGNPAHEPQLRYGRFPNPTAHIALNQLQRVVNLLVRTYGTPAQIVVELARDLKMSRDQKLEAQKRNRDNRNIRDRHRSVLLEHHQQDTADNLLRLRLYEEQERAGGGIARCPFSLSPIAIHQLFSSEVEVEHLLPYSRTLDDSAANKVVCFRSMNRLKRSKSPHEAFGNTPEWAAIAAAAIALPRNKMWRFAPDAMERFESSEKDFLTRQLNETRHISRMARIYLSKACHPNQVYVTSGQLTAMLRARWGLNSIFRDHNRQSGDDQTDVRTGKARDDHRHHAIDACVIGAIDRSVLAEISRRAGRAEAEGRDRITSDVPEPFTDFRDAVRAAVDRIVVSAKPEHGRGSALHEDTAYGIVSRPAEAEKVGNLVFRKPIVDLTIGEVERIRDERLRREALAAIEDVKSDRKASAAALAKFSTERGPGRQQGVRRVRIGKKEKNFVAIKNRTTGAIYKALIPGENHHVDIVQMRDGSWQGFAATVFDVNQKGWRPEWERKRLGGKLVMRLHKGDTIEVNDTDGLRRIKTVHRIEISANRIRLAAHNEGGKLQERHEDPNDSFRWDFANIGGLKIRNARKVKVDAIGQVRSMRSNVAVNS